MRFLKIFSLCVILIACIVCYFFSDFYEIRRLNGQIEKNLDIQLSSLPKLIDRENYGWAEEGGDDSLLQLNSKDCVSVKSKMHEEKEYDKKGLYSEIFSRNGFKPEKLSERLESNSHGDSVYYVLDASSCVLFRNAHFE